MVIRNIKLNKDIILRHLESFDINERKSSYDGKITEDDPRYKNLSTAIREAKTLLKNSPLAEFMSFFTSTTIQFFIEYGIHVGYEQAVRDMSNAKDKE